jgi:hypothetical protein
LTTSCHSLADDSRHPPFIKFGTFVRGGAATVLML